MADTLTVHDRAGRPVVVCWSYDPTTHRTTCTATTHDGRTHKRSTLGDRTDAGGLGRLLNAILRRY